MSARPSDQLHTASASISPEAFSDKPAEVHPKINFTKSRLIELCNLGVSGLIAEEWRAVYWMIYFSILPYPLQYELKSSPSNSSSISSNRSSNWTEALSSLRGKYEELKDRYIIDPNQSQTQEDGKKDGGNHPLALDETSPWNQWFSNIELRKTIEQDVERTFPEHVYFRQPSVQRILSNVLFIYAKLNPELSYRQGMHEVLAALLWVVSRARSSSNSEPRIHRLNPSMYGVEPETAEQLFDEQYTEHDTYWIFYELMRRYLNVWYEFNPSIMVEKIDKRLGKKSPSLSSLSPSSSSTALHPHSSPSQGRSTTNRLRSNSRTELITPLQNSCQSFFHRVLRVVDRELYNFLKDSGIEGAVFGIRWLRLLFNREYNLSHIPILWDGLFAYSKLCSVSDPPPQVPNNQEGKEREMERDREEWMEFIEYVCVEMLKGVKEDVLGKDYSAVLTTLLKPYFASSLFASSIASSSPSFTHLNAHPFNPSTLIQNAIKCKARFKYIVDSVEIEEENGDVVVVNRDSWREKSKRDADKAAREKASAGSGSRGTVTTFGDIVEVGKKVLQNAILQPPILASPNMSRRSKETSLKELADTVSSSASSSSSSIPKPSSEIIIPISIRPPIPQKSPVIARPTPTQNNLSLAPSVLNTNDLTLSTNDRNILSTKIVDWINLLSVASPPNDLSVPISVEKLGTVIDGLKELKRVVDREVLVGDVWRVDAIAETEKVEAEERATTTKIAEDVDRIPNEKDRTEMKENLVEASENRYDFPPSSLSPKLDIAAVENQLNPSNLTSITSVSSTPEHLNVTSISPPQSKNLPSSNSPFSQPPATPIPIPSVVSSSPTEPAISPAPADDSISHAPMPSTPIQPQLPSQPKQSILSLMQQEITELSKESSSIGMSRSNKQWGFIFGEDGQDDGSSDNDVFASLGKKTGKKWFE